ncbi:hypothetical protein Hanom_Chr03g00187521 [Helianthus anomalus]
MDVGPNVPTREQNYCCWRTFLSISSMIEIEVEMDSDVLAAESTSNAEETIAEQIEQIMEIENLEEIWRIQAEANDEMEKLLNSEILPSQQVSDI